MSTLLTDNPEYKRLYESLREANRLAGIADNGPRSSTSNKPMVDLTPRPLGDTSDPEPIDSEHGDAWLAAHEDVKAKHQALLDFQRAWLRSAE